VWRGKFKLPERQNRVGFESFFAIRLCVRTCKIAKVLENIGNLCLIINMLFINKRDCYFKKKINFNN
jgi:hypothetical protein